jgi:hypothetical protein
MEAQVLSNELLSDSREAVDPVYEPVTSPARFGGSSGVGVTVGELGSGSQSGKNISRPKCLLAESVQQSDGVGPVVDLDQHCCKLLVVTLGITDVVERTGLTRRLFGPPEHGDAPGRPLFAGPVEHESLGQG